MKKVFRLFFRLPVWRASAGASFPRAQPACSLPRRGLRALLPCKSGFSYAIVPFVLFYETVAATSFRARQSARWGTAPRPGLRGPWRPPCASHLARGLSLLFPQEPERVRGGGKQGCMQPFTSSPWCRPPFHASRSKGGLPSGLRGPPGRRHPASGPCLWGQGRFCESVHRVVMLDLWGGGHTVSGGPSQ